MDYLIPQPLAQAILDYLVQHPYAQVHPLVQALQQLKEARAIPEHTLSKPLPVDEDQPKD